MWAAGLAACAAVVAWWRVVGAGFIWLASGVALLFGVPTALLGAGAFAVAGCVLVAGGFVAAKRPMISAILLAAGAAGYAVAAVEGGSLLFSLAGAAALGGVTSEMLLGHWYLVDPRLPRWALRRLDVAGAIGLIADVGLLIADGVLDFPSGDVAIGWAFVTMAIATLALLIAVWFSLKEPSYTGVMAATGLSYLAVLTVTGAVVLGRVLLDPTGGTPVG